MRDTPGHISPGGRALRGHQFRNIVQRHHIAAIGIFGLLACNADGKISLTAVAADRDLILRPRPRPGRGHEIGQFGQCLGKRPAEGLAFGAANQFFRRPVEDADRAVSVDANDAGACTCQNGFSESPAAVDEIVRLHNVVTLRPQLLCHPVKCFAELRQVPFRLAHGNAHIKVSG